MSTLQELLQGYGARTAALTGDPASMSTYGATGGVLAPEETGPAQASHASPGDALQQLVAGYQKWATASRNPVASRSVLGASSLVRNPQAQGLAQVAQVNQQAGNPRAGQGFQTFEVLGRRYHVYYDENGKRKVVLAGKTAPAAA